MNHVITQKNSAKFIDPAILSKISNLELLARGIVEGFISGLHKSPYKGFSVEFLEYRPYSPGDDPMHIDWKLFLRSDRLYIKQFEDETNTSCQILFDISNSMDFMSGKISKFQYGRFLAASLIYFMIRQRDRVGISFFDNQIRKKIPPRSSKGHLLTILDSLQNILPGSSTDMGKPFHELADSMKKRGIIILISDLLDDPDKIINGLQHFRFNRNNVIVFQILDPYELAFQYNDMIELEDMETGEKIFVMPEEAKNVYQKNLEKFRSKLNFECGVLGIDYNVLSTHTPLDFALFQYLSKRCKTK
jgi:uncharacterized protein (DUF58 family)